MWSSDCTHQQLGETWESGKQPATGWKLKGSRKNYLRSLLKGLGCQWWILMRCQLGTQGWAPSSAGAPLELHTSSSCKDADPERTWFGKGTGNLLLGQDWELRISFKNVKCWVVLKSTLRRLRGVRPARMWPRTDSAHLPEFRHPLISHFWTQRNSHEVRQNLAKGFNLKNITAAPMIRYFILILVRIMF